MKISIAMTTYNGEDYIEKQMMSLLNQTRKADEIIICDDVSSDRTVAILQDIIKRESNSNCKLILNDNNLGYRKNFKKSIELTSGELIFLCDQDDIWELDKLEKLEKIFESHPEILALNAAFTMINANDQIIPYKDRKGFYNHDSIRGKADPGELKKIPYDMLLRYNISPGCTMAFRKNVKSKFLKYTKSILPHDWEINLLAGMKKGCYFLNTPMIKYRIHGKNTLGMNTNDHLSVFQFDQDLDFRVRSIKEKMALISIVEEWHDRLHIHSKQLKSFNKIKTYDLLREKVVCQHKLSASVPLVIMTILLWDGKYVRFKSMFGDLFYVIGRKK